MVHQINMLVSLFDWIIINSIKTKYMSIKRLVNELCWPALKSWTFVIILSSLTSKKKKAEKRKLSNSNIIKKYIK